MHITIHTFEDRAPQPQPDNFLNLSFMNISRTRGYWITFESDIVSGSALLVASGSVNEIRNRPLPQYISVETSVKAYENLRLLDDAEPHIYRFEPLPNPGDYDLIGKISQIYTNDGELWAMDVWVGACEFGFSKEQLNGVEVEKGAWVQFRVRELELFDENY
ncbi:MAG: hypothetical protein ACRYFS_17915 [Janthinobacterium lividum]